MLLQVTVMFCGLLVVGHSHPQPHVSKRQMDCPPGTAVAMCFRHPCENATCNVEGATCSGNYCGGCHAVWSDAEGNTLSPDSCRKTPKTVSTQRRDWFDDCDTFIMYCLRSPCDGATCPHEGATCQGNYCGGCNAEWFDADGNKIDDC